MAAGTASAYPRYHRQSQQDRRARPASGSGRAARHMPAPPHTRSETTRRVRREDLFVITGGPPCRASALRVPAVALVALEETRVTEAGCPRHDVDARGLILT